MRSVTSTAAAALAAAAVLTAAAACGSTSSAGGSTTGSSSASSSQPQSGHVHVLIHNFAFVPASITVKPGTTVTWTNEDSATHTVTSTTGVFNSGDLVTNKTFTYTFTKAGSYPYRCLIHQFMTGSVNVS